MTTNDNRMRWVRNRDLLNNQANKNYFVEYEIGSESRIPGIFNYNNQQILCGLLGESKNGLFPYSMRIKYAEQEQLFNKNANKRGYFLKGGILEELLSLFSVYFRCRFYPVTSFFGELSDTSIKNKMDFDFSYKPCNPAIHKEIFFNNGSNWAKGTNDFMNLVSNLDPALHQSFILACHHYHRALKEVGVDTEMVFIRLVSAIEALSKLVKLDTNNDPLSKINADNLIKCLGIKKDDVLEIKNILAARKSQKKFIAFVTEYSSGFFKGGFSRAPHTKIYKKDLTSVLNTIYTARSAYLHTGQSMYLSQPIHGSHKWDTDPSFGMTIDNHTFHVSEKLPYASFFEGLVRHCLIVFLKTHQSA